MLSYFAVICKINYLIIAKVNAAHVAKKIKFKKMTLSIKKYLTFAENSLATQMVYHALNISNIWLFLISVFFSFYFFYFFKFYIIMSPLVVFELCRIFLFLWIYRCCLILSIFLNIFIYTHVYTYLQYIFWDVFKKRI